MGPVVDVEFSRCYQKLTEAIEVTLWMLIKIVSIRVAAHIEIVELELSQMDTTEGLIGRSN